MQLDRHCSRVYSKEFFSIFLPIIVDYEIWIDGIVTRSYSLKYKRVQQIKVPGQAERVQVPDCVLAPLQELPFTGAGFVHVLDLVHVPLAHVTVQPLQELQEAQFPCTGINNNIQCTRGFRNDVLYLYLLIYLVQCKTSAFLYTMWGFKVTFFACVWVFLTVN